MGRKRGQSAKKKKNASSLSPLEKAKRKVHSGFVVTKQQNTRDIGQQKARKNIGSAGDEREREYQALLKRAAGKAQRQPRSSKRDSAAIASLFRPASFSMTPSNFLGVASRTVVDDMLEELSHRPAEEVTEARVSGFDESSANSASIELMNSGYPLDDSNVVTKEISNSFAMLEDDSDEDEDEGTSALFVPATFAIKSCRGTGIEAQHPESISKQKQNNPMTFDEETIVAMNKAMIKRKAADAASASGVVPISSDTSALSTIPKSSCLAHTRKQEGIEES